MNRSAAPPFAIELGAVMSPRRCGHPLINQTRIHRLNGVEDPQSVVDPFLAFVEGIVAVGEALTTHRPGFTAVITKQHATISKQHPVNVPVFTHGSVIALEEGARGVTFATRIFITEESGEPFADMTTNMLLIDLARQTQEGTARSPTSASPTPEAPEAVELGRHAFSPAAALAFEETWPPSLHSDPEQARAAGFAKPIISGNQVFSILWKRLIEPRYLHPVSLSFVLKRPIFWDEEVTFARILTHPTEPETIEVRNSGGKTAIVCKVEARA